MPPTDLITHAAAYDVPELIERVKISRSSDGLDTCTARYLSSTAGYFVIGSTVPDDTRFTVASLDESNEGGGYYEHDLRGEGLLTNPKQLTGYPDVTQTTEGWDSVQDVVISTNRNYFQRGQFGNYGGTTVCISANPKPINRAKTIYRITAQFQGVISAKPYRRVITSNGQKISGDSIVVDLPQGWNTGRKGTASLPKILVTDTYWGTTPAPTADVPGNRTPPNAPNVSVITFTGTDVTSQWPWGWEFTCGHRQLGGVGLFEVDMIYEWVPRYTP